MDKEISTNENLNYDKPLSGKSFTADKEKKSLKRKNLRSENRSQVKKNTSIGFLSYLLVISISFIALLLIFETFKKQIGIIIPSIDFYLLSLYESLKDIYLFFNDLIK